MVGASAAQKKEKGDALQPKETSEEVLKERTDDGVDTAHPGARGLRLPLQRVDIDARVERNEPCFHAARGVLEHETGGRQGPRIEGLGGEPADTCLDCLRRPRREGRLRKQVAARKGEYNGGREGHHGGGVA